MHAHSRAHARARRSNTSAHSTVLYHTWYHSTFIHSHDNSTNATPRHAVPRRAASTCAEPTTEVAMDGVALDDVVVVVLPLHGSAIAARLASRFYCCGCATLPASAVARHVPSGHGTVLATAWEVCGPTALSAMRLALGDVSVPGSIRGDFGDVAFGPIKDERLAKSLLPQSPPPPGPKATAPPKGTERTAATTAVVASSTAAAKSAPTSEASQGAAKRPAKAAAKAAPVEPVAVPSPARPRTMPSRTTAAPLVDLSIRRERSGVLLEIVPRVSKVSVTMHRPDKAGGDWLQLNVGGKGVAAKPAATGANGAAATGAAVAKGSRPAAPTDASSAVAPHDGAGHSHSHVYRSTGARAAMYPLLHHPAAVGQRATGGGRPELAFLFHSGRLPWYAAAA